MTSITATIQTRWVCPHCGTENYISVYHEDSKVTSKGRCVTDVRYCDSEIGGCDARCVVDVYLKVEAVGSKIGGEYPDVHEDEQIEPTELPDTDIEGAFRPGFAQKPDGKVEFIEDAIEVAKAATGKIPHGGTS